MNLIVFTPDRWQSIPFLTIDARGSKIARSSVFDCQLTPAGRQLAIENSVSNDFLSTFVDCIDVFDCHLPGDVKSLIYSFVYSVIKSELVRHKSFGCFQKCNF